MDCAMPATFKDLCLDAVDDHALARWWCFGPEEQ
jgi:hypothetical protein